MNSPLSRRQIIKGLGAVGCCAAASPLVTPVTVAAAPGENRLVVIILRGAMDGLDVVQPYGDANFTKLRPSLAKLPGEGTQDLDGRFAMHDGLSHLSPLWNGGELAFAHAVSTPYRDKRSHFDGQDILEAGIAHVGQARDGWVNRALSHMPGARADTALSIGRETMVLLSGANDTMSWAPGEQVIFEEDERGLLDLIYRDDPLFAEAAREAFALSMDSGGERAKGKRAAAVRAEYAAKRLREEARIAAFSIGGWDSHVNQKGALRGPLGQLSLAVETLKTGLGPEWSRTLVIAMTEFGRTARENGTRGTDHGTGGAALMAGGALRGGKVYGDWPGVRERDLYQNRDLMPTRDVRHYPAWALAGLFGVQRTALERDVFPGLDMGAGERFLL
ncbi:MAG: DUF1501 domain-containing protein [Pikeienuella sp.]